MPANFLFRSIIVLTLISFMSGSLAEAGKIYKHTDEQGNVSYSDSPITDEDTEVELPKGNTVAPPDNTPIRFFKRSSSKKQGNPALFIVTPENDSTVTPGQTTLSVQGVLRNPGDFKYRYQLYYDGEFFAQGDSPSFTITELYRGSHSLEMRAINAKGEVVSSSPMVTVHVIRPTVLN